MLQALDQEIDAEIKKGKKNDIIYKQNIAIYHGRKLDKTEKIKYVKQLLDEHNPCNSIIKKTFDGIEHIICECLECNKIYQQFATFRIIDLAVVSNEIILKNINIVCDNIYYHIPEISVLNYCSVDLLRYHTLQHLSKYEEIDYYDLNIIFISTNGKIDVINDYKISQIQTMNGAIFILVNTKRASQSETGRILQIDLAVNKNGNKSKILSSKNGVSIRYNKYDPNIIHKLARSQIKDRQQLLDNNNDNDEKYDYYIIIMEIY